MLRFFTALPHKPVLALIAINLLIGLNTFRDYGYSLDEPLFYGYADALGYAYSPNEWFSGDFDLERAYGPSPWDHRNRGPAYLLLARSPAHLLQGLGLDSASAWHLVNFLFFQFGVYFLYALCRRWMGPWGAFSAAALFSAQPVLWEHAFINPKDPPFMTFFLIALELGFRMAERMSAADRGLRARDFLKHIFVPGLMLGLATSIRILGPLAGALVFLYFLAMKKPLRPVWWIAYGAIAGAAMLLTWPYLWEGPIEKFIETLTFMSQNPTGLRVLFYGQLYRADELPLRYLPIMFLFTLTEPIWPLAALGAAAAVFRWRKNDLQWASLLSTVLWFALPVAYVLWNRPPMYDGFRHFMFILPPVFVLAGLAVEAAFTWIRNTPLRLLAAMLLIWPGVTAANQLHPYEYTYYNSFAGGTDRASYNFETDYWLTCYKDAIEVFNTQTSRQRTLFVRREGYIAAYYLDADVRIVDTSLTRAEPFPGAYLLESSRANKSLQRYRSQKQFTLIKRDNAVFCVIEEYSEK